jgi:hemolysin activation/secretion protein
VKITEPPPFHLELAADNQRPPSVGAEELEMLASYRNLLGYNDAIEFNYGILHRSDDGTDFYGLDNLAARYDIPFTVSDTTLELRYRRSDFAIIEEPFAV